VWKDTSITDIDSAPFIAPDDLVKKPTPKQQERVTRATAAAVAYNRPADRAAPTAGDGSAEAGAVARAGAAAGAIAEPLPTVAAVAAARGDGYSFSFEEGADKWRTRARTPGSDEPPLSLTAGPGPEADGSLDGAAVAVPAAAAGMRRNQRRGSREQRKAKARGRAHRHLANILSPPGGARPAAGAVSEGAAGESAEGEAEGEGEEYVLYDGVDDNDALLHDDEWEGDNEGDGEGEEEDDTGEEEVAAAVAADAPSAASPPPSPRRPGRDGGKDGGGGRSTQLGPLFVRDGKFFRPSFFCFRRRFFLFPRGVSSPVPSPPHLPLLIVSPTGDAEWTIVTSDAVLNDPALRRYLPPAPLLRPSPLRLPLPLPFHTPRWLPEGVRVLRSPHSVTEPVGAQVGLSLLSLSPLPLMPPRVHPS